MGISPEGVDHKLLRAFAPCPWNPCQYASRITGSARLDYSSYRAESLLLLLGLATESFLTLDLLKLAAFHATEEMSPNSVPGCGTCCFQNSGTDMVKEDAQIHPSREIWAGQYKSRRGKSVKRICKEVIIKLKQRA